jgi:serine/threonine-protein kinase
MTKRSCPGCGNAIPDEQRYCGHCGADASVPAAAATATSVPEESAGATLAAGSTERFSAGTVIAGRYRIVGLLGIGGMGEVYRADDLKLVRPVALKFLPSSFEREPRRLSRLLNEVRTALSVSHPNVCRVHDVQQEAGRHFITMEFVDGDDLSALLRRIGRLPQDKALQIARQLCAGLSSAHRAGVLHRDLKPANIMIDGRGQVKITDFGLAGLTGEFRSEDVGAGTPAYMAPEQLAGEEVTEASDIYALGLVLYEVYTGKPAYEGTTAAELARRRSSAPTSPSSHITDIDPAVERVILRCLDPDPRERPASAMAVSAALPGGDPLADALAAGETPAPELVAEAGAVGGLKPWQAWGLLATFVVAVLASIALNPYTVPATRTGLPKSVAVLQEKAREILNDLGIDYPRRDTIYDFSYNAPYVRHLNSAGIDTATYRGLENPQPALVHFGYRQSGGWLTYESGGSIGDWVERSPPEILGDVRLRLDLTGRLVWLDVVTPETGSESQTTDDRVWSRLLSAAGFDADDLTAVGPRWFPPRAFDARRAWEGVYPDAPDVEIRIEAASFGGIPVAFRIVEPWTEPLLASPRPLTGPGSFEPGLMAFLVPAIFVSMLVVVALLAWRNVRMGRGDRRTALRFALAAGALRMSWYLVTRHVPDDQEISILIGHIAYSLYRFGYAYAFYLAIEPYARKLWPRTLTSWVRLFDGRFRDPLVGRDVLIGLALAVFVPVGPMLGVLGMRAGWGFGSLHANFTPLEALRGIDGAVLSVVAGMTEELITLFIVVTLVLVSRLLLRRGWLMPLPLFLIFFGFAVNDRPVALAVVAAVVVISVFLIALLRVGLLAFAVMILVDGLLDSLPLTFDLGAWWAAPTWIVLLLLVPLALWSFRTALAGQPVFRERLLEG